MKVKKVIFFFFLKKGGGFWRTPHNTINLDTKIAARRLKYQTEEERKNAQEVSFRNTMKYNTSCIHFIFCGCPLDNVFKGLTRVPDGFPPISSESLFPAWLPGSWSSSKCGSFMPCPLNHLEAAVFIRHVQQVCKM